MLQLVRAVYFLKICNLKYLHLFQIPTAITTASIPHKMEYMPQRILFSTHTIITNLLIHHFTFFINCYILAMFVLISCRCYIFLHRQLSLISNPIVHCTYHIFPIFSSLFLCQFLLPVLFFMMLFNRFFFCFILFLLNLNLLFNLYKSFF